MELIKKTWQEFSSDDCFRMAAALAYYTVFSLPPLLVIVISIAGIASKPFLEEGESAVQGEIKEQIETVLGASAGDQVDSMIRAASERNSGIIATIVGLVVLLLGATGVLVQLQSSLNETWDVQPDPESGGIKNYLLKRLISLAMLLAIGFLLVVSLVVSTTIRGLSEQLENWLPVGVPSELVLAGNFVLSWAIFIPLFAAIFKYMPDAEVQWRDVWIGATLTGLLLTLGQFLLSVYFSTANVASTYGAAGSLALILVWVYYSSLILLFGAEFTQVWARRHGRQIRPSAGAVRVVEKTQRVGPAAT
jgi:membrane protein